MTYVASVAITWSMAAAISVLSLMGSTSPSAAEPSPGSQTAAAPQSPDKQTRLDRSGKTQTGLASFYASRYSGRKMADGTPMRPDTNNAASLTLPLGTVARVTNLRTGQSAIIRIRDRGPYVHGRIVDLSPATARLIGLEKRQGLTEVTVAPLNIPASKVDSAS